MTRGGGWVHPRVNSKAASGLGYRSWLVLGGPYSLLPELA